MSERRTRRRFVGEAAGLAAGVWLAGRPGVALASASGSLRPLILVHGFADQAWTWRRADNALVNRLLQAGYDWESGSLVAYSYPPLSGSPELADSQGDIRAAGERLADLVQAVAAGGADGQVDLLGFSMGGLVARSAIGRLRTSGDGRGLVRSLLTIATPNNGADLLTLVERLAAQPQAAVEDLARELLGVDLDGTAARQMMPGSEFLTQLNQVSQTDDRLSYVTLAGAAQLALRAGPISRQVGVGDGVVSVDSASYLAGLAHRAYVLPELLGPAATPWAALRQSQVIHPRLMFNDNAALVAASELAPNADDLRAALNARLASGEIRRDARS
jgi:pimeloyl-ACP methyl ester carboxylesterase